MVIKIITMMVVMFTLRYPMDFTFHLQNFSALNYVKTVKSKQQVMIMMMIMMMLKMIMIMMT